MRQSSFVARLVFCGSIAVGFAAQTSFVAAQSSNNNKIPAGHSYSPNQEKLPSTNSRKYRLNSQTDIYETEIYRKNRETAITFSNMGLYGGNNFNSGGQRNRPRY